MKPLALQKTSAERTFPSTDLYKGTNWWQPYPISAETPCPTHFWRNFSCWCDVCEVAKEVISRLYAEPSGENTDSMASRSISISELEDFETKFDALDDSFVGDLESDEHQPGLPHYYQLRHVAVLCCRKLRN